MHTSLALVSLVSLAAASPELAARASTNSACNSLESVLSTALDNFPTPTDSALVTYLFSATATDPCVLVANAPQSLSAQVSAYTSVLVPYITANAPLVSSFEASCTASPYTGLQSDLASVTALASLTSCPAPGSNPGPTSNPAPTTSHNGAPIQTGTGAMAAAAALLLGAVVGL